MVILTDKPVQKAMTNPEAVGRMALWAIELSEFDVQYHPRIAMKGQAVTDFIVEFTNIEGQGVEEHPQWSIYTDRSFNRRASGSSIVLRSLEGDKIKCRVHLDFPMTNNEAEYEALVAGLDLAKTARATSVVVYYNFQVVTSQVNGDYECKGKRIKKYLKQIRK